MQTQCLSLARSLGNKIPINMLSRKFHCSSLNLIEDYYKILGVQKHATDKEIKQRYFILAKKYHPDANPGDATAAANFQKVSEAYETLGNSSKRRSYDMMGFNSYSQSSQGFSNRQHTNNPFTDQEYNVNYQKIDPKEVEDMFKLLFQGFNKKTRLSQRFLDSMISVGFSKLVMEEMMKSSHRSHTKAKYPYDDYEIKIGPNGIEMNKKKK